MGTSQSDFLAPCDLITSINDKRVHGLRGDQINELFRGAKEKVLVELEYELPSIKKGRIYGILFGDEILRKDGKTFIE